MGGWGVEYWLSFLKVATVIVFIVVGVVVNVGGNREQRFIGLQNWRIEGAPFHNGFVGFAKVFVTASFACTFFPLPRFGTTALMLILWSCAVGGTESLGITAGETKNPSKNMPRVVKMVFWRYAT